jgi:hypothetical protein
MTYTYKLARRLAQNGVVAGAVVALALLGCQSDPASLESDVSTIRISPRSALLAPQGAVQFSAFTETPAGRRVPAAVTWSAEGGRIDADGRFVAGDVDGAFRVRATHASRQWVTDSSTTIVLHGPTPTALRIHPHEVTVGAGAEVWLTAWALSAAGDSVAIPALFTAEGATLAPDSTGTVPYSAGAEGDVTVTGEAGPLVDAARITVSRVAVATVDVKPDSATLALNGTVQLTATLKDAGGRILTGRQVRWRTADPAIATVTSTGLVRAKASGTAQVGAVSERKSDITLVRVGAPPPPPPPPPAAVASVTVTPDSASLGLSDTLRLTAVARDGGGNVLTGRSFTWTVANGSVASVSTTGKVTALAVGLTAVTLTCEGRTAAALVVVAGAPPPPPPADGLVVIFQDDFESGGLSRTSADFRWGASNGESGSKPGVTSTIARSGSKSLRFTFLGNASLSDDAWSEQRFTFTKAMTEVYLDWYQYFPDGSEGLGPRFEYRNADGSDNNKFLLLWDDDYSNDRLCVGFESEWTSGSDGRLVTKWEAGTSPFGNKGADIWDPAITNALRGRWVQFRMHVKVASAANNDGIVELWVDGVKKIENRNLPMYAPGGLGNYMKNGYLMGWANTGFTNTSLTYIDDFTVSVPVP